MSFGGGPHRCLGMHLARMEAQTVFGRMAELIDALEPAGEPVRAESALGSYCDVPVRAAALR